MYAFIFYLKYLLRSSILWTIRTITRLSRLRRSQTVALLLLSFAVSLHSSASIPSILFPLRLSYWVLSVFQSMTTPSEWLLPVLSSVWYRSLQVSSSTFVFRSSLWVFTSSSDHTKSNFKITFLHRRVIFVLILQKYV